MELVVRNRQYRIRLSSGLERYDDDDNITWSFTPTPAEAGDALVACALMEAKAKGWLAGLEVVIVHALGQNPTLPIFEDEGCFYMEFES